MLLPRQSCQVSALVPPSESGGGIIGTGDKSQFKVLFGLAHCADMFVCFFGCSSVCFVSELIKLQQEHLADVGLKPPSSIFRVFAMFRSTCHTQTLSNAHTAGFMYAGVLYTSSSHNPGFLPSSFGSLNPPWLNTFQTTNSSELWWMAKMFIKRKSKRRRLCMR